MAPSPRLDGCAAREEIGTFRGRGTPMLVTNSCKIDGHNAHFPLAPDKAWFTVALPTVSCFPVLSTNLDLFRHLPCRQAGTCR